MGFDLPAAIGACVAQDRPARRVPRRRRQHHAEPAGAADHRGARPADQDLRAQQQRLSLDPPDAAELLPRQPGGRGAGERRHLPRLRAAGLRLRHPVPALRHARGLAGRDPRDARTATGPQLCEIVLDPEQPFSPRVSSKRLPDGRMVTAPLEDMFPFLPREEFLGQHDRAAGAEE